MDAILTQLLSFPPHPPPTPPLTDAEYDKQAKAHIQNLSKFSSNKITSGATSSNNPIEILNPSINSISYLCVLLAHIITGNSKQKSQTVSDAFAPGEPLWLKASAFMDCFDPVQIRYTGHEIRRLMEIMASVALTFQVPGAAISPIRSAILRIDPSSSTFTSSHLQLVYLSLIARAYVAALPILDQDIFHFPSLTNKSAEDIQDPLYPYLCSPHESSSTYISARTGFTSKLEYHDHLQYFLYGAMCYMGLRDWERAILFLEIVLISPTSNTASKIQVEAYKKWVLISLLHRGKSSPVPKTTQSQASKMYQNLSKPYTALADIFKKSLNNEESSSKVLAEAQAAEKIFAEDYNTGLVRQVLSAYHLFSVRRLENTYAALSIGEVARRVEGNGDVAEMGQYIIRLISSGQLNATISKPNESEPGGWILRFSAHAAVNGCEPGTRSEEQQLDELERQVEKVRLLRVHVREADRKFGVSREYIQEAKRVRKGKESAGIGGGAGGEMGGETWGALSNEAFDADEDLMGDLQ